MNDSKFIMYRAIKKQLHDINYDNISKKQYDSTQMLVSTCFTGKRLFNGKILGKNCSEEIANR